jgi:hypothetical protein
MENHSPDYLAYLLRLWYDEAAPSWRATLENPHNGETLGFASLQQLYNFLEEQTGKEASENSTDLPGATS